MRSFPHRGLLGHALLLIGCLPELPRRDDSGRSDLKDQRPDPTFGERGEPSFDNPIGVDPGTEKRLFNPPFALAEEFMARRTGRAPGIQAYLDRFDQAPPRIDTAEDHRRAALRDARRRQRQAPQDVREASQDEPAAKTRQRERRAGRKARRGW